MANKTINGRVIQKHDTEANWQLAINFIPYVGEIIIYDKDDNYPYERIKVGDGVNKVSDLPFIVDYDKITYAEKESYVSMVGDASIVNYLKLSKDLEGNIYNGTGYKNGVRFSTSAAGETTAGDDYGMSGFIPAQKGDILRAKNITRASSSSPYIVHYDSNKNYKGTQNVSQGVDASGVLTTTIANTSYDIAYIRTSFCSFNEESIITINQDFFMTGTAQIGWLKTEKGVNIAPKSLTSQVFNVNGKTVDELLEEVKTHAENYAETGFAQKSHTHSVSQITNSLPGKYIDGKNASELFNSIDGAIGDIYKEFSGYAVEGHDHDDDYSLKNHTHTEYSKTGHDHYTADIIFDAPTQDDTILKHGENLDENLMSIEDAILSKQNKIKGAASSITEDNLTGNRVLISNSSGKVAASDVTTDELNEIKSTVPSLQNQINDSVSEVLNSINEIDAKVDGLDYYNKFYFRGGASTFAGAPSDGDGGYELAAEGKDSIRFVSEDGLIDFDVIDRSGEDEVRIYVNADPAGSAQEALNEAKTLINEVKSDVDTFFLDADFAENSKDTLKEIQEYMVNDTAAATQIVGDIADLKDEVSIDYNEIAFDTKGPLTTVEVDLRNYQRREDNDLTTENKTIVGAINELSSEVANEAVNRETLINEVSNNIAQLSNPNLLINSDFRNPINQRGKTSGKSWEYTIDRWRAKFAHELTFNATGMTINNISGEINILQQILEFGITGTYTLTAKINSLIGGSFEGYIGGTQVFSATTSGVYSGTASVSGANIIQFLFSGNAVVEIEWIKLEQGSIATPFVPRPYSEELALCQRYYRKLSSWASSYPLRGDNNSVFIFLTGVMMRTNPTISALNAGSVPTLSYGGTASGMNPSSNNISSTVIGAHQRWDGVEIEFKRETEVVNNGSGVLTIACHLDAEIY